MNSTAVARWNRRKAKVTKTINGQNSGGRLRTSTENTCFIFGQTSNFAFGTNAAPVTFSPPNGQDTKIRGEVTTNINTKDQCSTEMRENQNTSLEELHADDSIVNHTSKEASFTRLMNSCQTPCTKASTGFVFGIALGSDLHKTTTDFKTSCWFNSGSVFGVQLSLAEGSLSGDGASETKDCEFWKSRCFSFDNKSTSNTCGLSIEDNLTGPETSAVLPTVAARTWYSAWSKGSTDFNTSASPASSVLFGTSVKRTPSLFGQTSATSSFAGGDGNTRQAGTTISFKPLYGQDTMMMDEDMTDIDSKYQSISAMKEYENNSLEDTVMSRDSIAILIKYQCISAMMEYENNSLEELRLEDYKKHRKSKQTGDPEEQQAIQVVTGVDKMVALHSGNNRDFIDCTKLILTQATYDR